MNPDDLERLIGRELKDLPAPRAPRTLLPRVLAATVHRAPAPWYSRPWLSWPLGWQVASVALLASLGAAAWALLALPGQGATGVAGIASGVGSGIGAVYEFLRQASVLLRVSWRLLLAPVAVLVFVMAVSLSLASALLWTMLNRVALGGASES